IERELCEQTGVGRTSIREALRQLEAEGLVTTVPHRGPIVSTITVEEAEQLRNLAAKNDLLFCVTYTYSGYPLVKQAKKLIADGKLGDIIMVMGEYPQDWLITPAEESVKQAAWRTDPKYSGVSNCIGDIGSHIENTVSYITGLKIKSLCAKLDIIGKGRKLDTNGSILVKYDNGASGVYWASQVAIGNDNALKVRIFGTKGSIEWAQEDPNVMKVTYLGQPTQIFARGHGYLDKVGSGRIPSGHTEGYYEAFANIYNNFANALLSKKAGKPLSPEEADYPDITAGVEGVRFITKCVESSQKGAVWVDL
ncbi:MAG TPA: Gfo/Idh/MocA family oxidoreductase, partial [Clostridia bacterium]|nr:Gfo/Idh/MocA family oxidoreductase [Clostridia bacterium]